MILTAVCPQPEATTATPPPVLTVLKGIDETVALNAMVFAVCTMEISLAKVLAL